LSDIAILEAFADQVKEAKELTAAINSCKSKLEREAAERQSSQTQAKETTAIGDQDDTDRGKEEEERHEEHIETINIKNIATYLRENRPDKQLSSKLRNPRNYKANARNIFYFILKGALP